MKAKKKPKYRFYTYGCLSKIVTKIKINLSSLSSKNPIQRQKLHKHINYMQTNRTQKINKENNA